MGVPSEASSRQGKRRIDRSTSKRPSKKVGRAAITASFLSTGSCRLPWSSCFVTGNWPAMTRRPSRTMAIVLAPSAEFRCSAVRWSSPWSTFVGRNRSVSSWPAIYMQCSKLLIDRDLPQAYGRAGGRLDCGRPKVFPSSKRSHDVMWPNLVLDPWQVQAGSAFHLINAQDDIHRVKSVTVNTHQQFLLTVPVEWIEIKAVVREKRRRKGAGILRKELVMWDK